MHEQVAYKTTERNSIYLILYFPHLPHICFNLTLSILEMRRNPVKPF